MIKRLALIGATSSGWRGNVWKTYNEKNEVYVGFTYRITRSKVKNSEELLRREILESPERMFRVYFYHSKKRGGKGQVVDVGYVDCFITGRSPSETPKVQSTPPGDVGCGIYKTWLHVKELKEILRPIDVLSRDRNLFLNFDSNKPFHPSQIRNGFAYVVDIGDGSDQPV